MIMNIAVILLVLIGLSFIFGPGLQLNPESFKMKQKPEFIGTLSPNNILDSTKRLIEGSIGEGPESIVVKDKGKPLKELLSKLLYRDDEEWSYARKILCIRRTPLYNPSFNELRTPTEFWINVVYTGVESGQIQRIEGQKLETLVRIGGNNCEVLGSGPNGCGRPLGMRLTHKGDKLVVADAQKGLYTVVLKTGKVTTLVSSSTQIDGKSLGYPNDLAMASNGDIYFSDASYKWGHGDEKFPMEVIENAGNGRIIYYNAKDKTVKTLVSNIHFANGVELSPEEDYVIFAEMMRANLQKYYLKGPKKGQIEFFHENLPGFPDNIRRSSRGTYWLAFAAVRIPYERNLYEQLSEYPFIRRVLYSTIAFLTELFRILKYNFPNSLFRVIHQQIHQWQSSIIFENRDYGLIIELNSEGEILRSFHSPKGLVNRTSQVLEDDNSLYISSYENDFIGKLALNLISE